MCLYHLHKRGGLAGTQFSVRNSGYQGSGRFTGVSPGVYWRQHVALHRTPIEEGALLNGKRLVVNIAHDVGLRLQNDLATSDRTLDRPIHDYSFGLNGAYNLSLARNNK